MSSIYKIKNIYLFIRVKKYNWKIKLSIKNKNKLWHYADRNYRSVYRDLISSVLHNLSSLSHWSHSVWLRVESSIVVVKWHSMYAFKKRSRSSSRMPTRWIMLRNRFRLLQQRHVVASKIRSRVLAYNAPVRGGRMCDDTTWLRMGGSSFSTILLLQDKFLQPWTEIWIVKSKTKQQNNYLK